ncbi:hypothetical protein IFR05_012956 [Cadophora sp. M221]|nr:hypothetical protein IFR05_012956 [Cadophora sp. M221]
MKSWLTCSEPTLKVHDTLEPRKPSFAAALEMKPDEPDEPDVPDVPWLSNSKTSATTTDVPFIG